MLDQHFRQLMSLKPCKHDTRNITLEYFSHRRPPRYPQLTAVKLQLLPKFWACLHLSVVDTTQASLFSCTGRSALDSEGGQWAQLRYCPSYSLISLTYTSILSLLSKHPAVTRLAVAMRIDFFQSSAEKHFSFKEVCFLRTDPFFPWNQKIIGFKEIEDLVFILPP